MADNADRILTYLAQHRDGADDDKISEDLGFSRRQQVNGICRGLVTRGLIIRGPGPGGKIVNRLPGSVTAGQLDTKYVPPIRVDPPLVNLLPTANTVILCGPVEILADAPVARNFAYTGALGVREDRVIEAMEVALRATGWTVRGLRGHQRGIDIESTRGTERLVLEAKGEGSLNPMFNNYFLGALGELLQRMEHADTVYGLALPAHAKFIRLACELPLQVRRRLDLCFYFLRPEGACYRVGYMPPPSHGMNGL